MLKLALPFLAMLTCPAFAQFNNILIHDVGNPKETSIAINPKNTSQVVAGANLDNYYYSNDGGLSWTLGKLASPYGVWGDPCLVADTSGNFYFSHLSNVSFGETWLDRIVIQKSSDGGATWNEGTYAGLNLPKDQDKPWMAFDANPQSPHKGKLYIAWTEFDNYGSDDPQNQSRILFSTSPDAAASWSEPIVVSEMTGDCIDSDNTAEGAVPAVGPNGEVYLSWSLDDTIWFDRSLDGGATWLANDIFATTQPGGWNFNVPEIYRCNGFPVTACDLSGGPHHGTIYINFSDQRNGSDDTDVFLIKSTDGGNTWSQPVRVNNDPPGRHNFFTWMAIDQSSGFLYFVFYDRRDHPDANTEVYLAYSTDGGETFVNLKISGQPFLPNGAFFFGDYTGIAAHEGHIHTIWTAQNQAGVTSIWTAASQYPVGTGSGNFFALQTNLQNRPNPFFGKTKITFNTAVNQSLTLSIHDVFGQEAALVFTEKKFANGAHEVLFDNAVYQLKPGIYFLKLSNGQAVETCKMMVLE
jgi:hypothetical protein